MTDVSTKEMTEEEWYYQFADCVTAALQTCAAKRWVSGGGECEEGVLIDRVVRTTDIVETASAKIAAKDLGAVHEVFASQALVLDEIFTQFASMAAKDPEFFKTSMTIALKAQSQCRWTLKALLAMNQPRPVSGARSPNDAPEGDAHNFSGQTIESGKIHA